MIVPQFAGFRIFVTESAYASASAYVSGAA
jgi:hypothetical protein